MKDLKGKIFGELEVLYPLEKRSSQGLVIWQCKCSCGKLCEALSRDLIRGHKKSCGHLHKTVCIGERYGNLEVLSILPNRTSMGDVICHCRCDCGNECDINSHSMKQGLTLSCGCRRKETAVLNGKKTTLELTNKRFGRITALFQTSERNGRNIMWMCKCDCGNILKIPTDRLHTGAILSCGCLQSAGEDKISSLLRAAKILFIHHYRETVFNRKLVFDFAILSPLTNLPLYFIEYDGKQHFNIGGWNTEEKLKATIVSDNLKDKWCTRNNIPLIRIPYTHFENLSLADLCLESSSFIISPKFSSWNILCRYMRAHSTWERDFERLKIKVKKYDSLVMLNYSIDCDFSNPLCKAARGIIIDTDNFSVQCVGFDKFFNFSELYADKIDWSTARVQEKVDGSIVKMFYSEKLGEWCWATNGCIFAKDAPTATGSNYQALIESTAEYRQIQNIINGLDKIYTFIFELVGPENQVVIQYPRPFFISY